VQFQVNCTVKSENSVVRVYLENSTSNGGNGGTPQTTRRNATSVGTAAKPTASTGSTTEGNTNGDQLGPSPRKIHIHQRRLEVVDNAFRTLPKSTKQDAETKQSQINTLLLHMGARVTSFLESQLGIRDTKLSETAVRL
jgi:hypothetical protein